LTATPSPPLGRADAEFLTALSGAFQRAQMYPGGHPILDRAVDQAIRRAEPLLAERPAAIFAVGPTQLFVGDTASDPEHPLLRELATRLFRRNVGAIRVARGVTGAELLDLLNGLSPDHPKLLDLATPHLEIEPLDYTGLALDPGDGGPGPTSQEEGVAAIWTGLAHAMIEGRGSGAVDYLPQTGEELARQFEALPQCAGSDAAIAGHLQAAVAVCRDRQTPHSTALRRQVTQLLDELRPDTLERLLTAAGGQLNAPLAIGLVDVSSASLALDLLHAASRVEGRALSPALLRLLGKLAAHAETGPSVSRQLADRQLQETLREVITGWNGTADPDEEVAEDNGLLEHLPAPLVPDLDPTEAYRSDPLRILTMELDMGELTGAARRAVRTLVARGRVGPLVRLLDEVEPSNPQAAEMRHLVVTTDAVAALLAARPLDVDSLERLAPEVGVPAIPLLLDALASAEERNVRRRLLELVARFGNAATPHALARLDAGPWYVQRNLLRLMQMLPEPAAEAVASKFAQHPDIRVRIEGLRLLLRHPVARTRGIVQGLSDPDLSGVRVAVMAAVEDCPPAAAPLLLRGLLEGRLDPGLRPAAIRAVGPLVQEPSVLDLLLKLGFRRVPFLGLRVAPKSKESLAALSALARHWGWHPRVARVITRAERHRDLDIREAVETPSILEQLGVEPRRA
jgi:hypothetical protein